MNKLAQHHKFAEMANLPEGSYIYALSISRLLILQPTTLHPIPHWRKPEQAKSVLQGEAMSNRSLRERFGAPENSAPLVSRIISETVQERLIKPNPATGRSRRFASYLPAWA